jgi:hypothetical protein
MNLDLKQSAVQLGKAIGDPITGLSALRRSGISFTASQQETIKTLVETNRTLDAQKLILGELERQVAGQAGIKTFKDAVLALGNSFGTLIEHIGNAIIKNKEINKAIVGLRNLLTREGTIDGVKKFAKGLSDVINVSVKVVKAIWPIVKALGTLQVLVVKMAVLFAVDLVNGVRNFIRAVPGLAKSLDLIGKGIAAVAKWFNRGIEAMDNAADASIASGVAMLRTAEAEEELADKAEDAAEAVNDLTAAEKANKAAAEALKKETEEVAAIFEDLGITTKEQLTKQMKENEAQAEKLKAAFKAERISVEDLEAGLLALTLQMNELKVAAGEEVEVLEETTEAVEELEESEETLATATDKVKASTEALTAAMQGTRQEMVETARVARFTSSDFDRLADSKNRAAAVEAALAGGAILEMGGRRIRFASGGSRLTLSSDPHNSFSSDRNIDGSPRRF